MSEQEYWEWFEEALTQAILAALLEKAEKEQKKAKELSK